jgi:hypothetical protein
LLKFRIAQLKLKFQTISFRESGANLAPCFLSHRWRALALSSAIRTADSNICLGASPGVSQTDENKLNKQCKCMLNFTNFLKIPCKTLTLNVVFMNDDFPALASMLNWSRNEFENQVFKSWFIDEPNFSLPRRSMQYEI